MVKDTLFLIHSTIFHDASTLWWTLLGTADTKRISQINES